MRWDFWTAPFDQEELRKIEAFSTERENLQRRRKGQEGFSFPSEKRQRSKRRSCSQKRNWQNPPALPNSLTKRGIRQKTRFDFQTDYLLVVRWSS